jgi:hypothetical protein
MLKNSGKDQRKMAKAGRPKQTMSIIDSVTRYRFTGLRSLYSSTLKKIADCFICVKIQFLDQAAVSADALTKTLSSPT